MNKKQLLSEKEQLLSKKEQIEKIAKIVLIAGIFLYPFLCSFFGIDLVTASFIKRQTTESCWKPMHRNPEVFCLRTVLCWQIC